MPARASTLALGLAGVLVLVLGSVLPWPGGTSPASGQPAAGEPQAQTDDSLPAENVTMIGASPQEAPDETWGLGEVQGGSGASPTVLVRYTSEGGWGLGPALLDTAGTPLAGFRLDHPTSLLAASPLSGRMTASGSGVLLGTVPGSPAVACGDQRAQQVVLVRDPGGAFRETPAPAGEAALQAGECLFGANRAPLVAALDEGEGRAGALVVPVQESSSVEDSVLHWDGSTWTREPILVPAASALDFRVLAIDASSPQNAWLLAQLAGGGGYPPGAVALFRREAPAGSTVPGWKPVALVPGSGDGEAHPLVLDGEPFTVHGTGEPPTVEAQVLTVTEQGVWVDGERQDVHAPATLFFQPSGSDGGTVAQGWCLIPAGAPPDSPPCDHTLPQELPTGPSRSFAWQSSGEPFGERVITGLPDGVTLRLDGTGFTRVLALGGGVSREPGAEYGAAFSSAREGWLGEGQLPVHITMNPLPSRLTSWPVSFRHALLAIAPEPGAPVGALSSGALAVGDDGEVARYEPGTGWVPESLLGPGGRVEAPRLRAVAWPTPDRAYAVGDLGQMWMWRGETGLWEPDPGAEEVTANMLGVAFDPGDPTRGYAVGTGGTLLGYGKSWTQEPLPAQAQGASFTSIAFAGSEAIVAYRKLLDPSRRSSYVGGLLVNEGNGWQVDGEAQAVLGSASKVPEVVAGLPDGGAAFVAESYGPGEGGAELFTRQGPGQPWEAAPTPLPHGSAPASIALFREQGTLRVVAAGSAPDSFESESVTPSPPGAPPPVMKPYPLPSEDGVGVVRETANGWSDQQHELNDVGEPAGKYTFFDTVYQPDPIRAVMVDPTGTLGWAVGGATAGEGEEGVADTADVERYPADGVTPPGASSAPIATNPNDATFAIGGNAQCAAPCADRANARLGPDVWLSAALARAGQISGVRAFLYTGPRVTSGETSGPPTLAVPFERELARYAQLISQAPLPTYVAMTPTDLAGSAGECTFDAEFEGFPGILQPAARSEEPCSAQAGYYEIDSAGPAGTVRVVVLDDTTDVGQTQLEWLTGRLAAAEAAGVPVIGVGNADLAEQMAAGDPAAAAVVRALVLHGASAYFFDSPEENVQRPLQIGSVSIPSFGSGTLGYVNALAESSGEFLGASGFLLAQADLAARAPHSNRVPVTVRLIPNIGELAMEAKDGTLLRRSQAALFSALARRPRAGNRSPGGAGMQPDTDPYIPIPSTCVGSRCASGIFPEYTFTSSRPEIGQFVEPDLSSADPRAVLLEHEKPIPDPQSGLFCAYNAGTTVVTITAGGISSSLPVTVQAGSVRLPCGTQPLSGVGSASVVAPPPAPAPAPAPAGASPAPAVLLPPPPLPPAPPGLQQRPPAQPPKPFVFAAPPAALLAAIVPPPPPTARPSPPGGTTTVTSPVEAAEKEDEQEQAPESVSNSAVAYRAGDDAGPVPAYILGIVFLAALAGASARRRTRARRRRAPLAYASTRGRDPYRRLDPYRHRSRGPGGGR